MRDVCIYIIKILFAWIYFQDVYYKILLQFLLISCDFCYNGFNNNNNNNNNKNNNNNG